MATVETASPFLRVLFAQDDERRLSRSLLETLAVVAYKQPVTKPEVDHVRGVGSDYALRSGCSRKRLRDHHRPQRHRRPPAPLRHDRDRFLDQFGLAGLDELPRPREIDELLADPPLRPRTCRPSVGPRPEALRPASDSTLPSAE